MIWERALWPSSCPYSTLYHPVSISVGSETTATLAKKLLHSFLVS